MVYEFQLVLVHGIVDAASLVDAAGDIHSFFSRRYKKAAVTEFQFSSSVLFISSVDIRLRGKLIAEKLFDQRQNGELPKDLPLIFIGHDLGGCMIKQVVITIKEQPIFQSMYPMIKGLIFFGTPHRGTDIISWEQYVIRLLASSEFITCHTSQLIQSLGSPLLQGAEAFATISWNFCIANIFQRAEQNSKLPLILHEQVTNYGPQGDVDISFSGTHAGLWEFCTGEWKTEMTCRIIDTWTKDGHQPCHGQLSKFLHTISQFCAPTNYLCTEERELPAEYIASNPKYRDWLKDPDVRILRIVGAIGPCAAEVTYLSLRSMLAQQQNKPQTILSFNFARNDVQAKSQMSMFSSICRQLLLAQPSLFKHVQPLCEFLLTHHLFNEKLLCNLFCSLIEHSSKSAIYCMINCIDECDEPLTSMIECLSTLMDNNTNSLKLILTSKDLTPIDAIMPDSFQEKNILQIEDSDLADFATFVQTNVERVAERKPVWVGLNEDIIRVLSMPPTTQFSAMRRMAILESANIPSTRMAVSRQIQCLSDANQEPPSQAAWDQKDAWVRSAFRWLSYAARPLTASELAVAVAIDGFDPQVHGTLANIVSRDIIGDLVRMVGPLFKLVNNRVALVYWNLRKASTGKDEELSDEEPHLNLLKGCFKYLDYVKSFPHGHLKENDMPNLEGKFIRYTCLYWPVHYHRLSTAGKSQGITHTMMFLRNKSSLSFWAKSYGEEENVGYGELIPITQIQVICRFGLNEVLQLAISNGQLRTESKDWQEGLDYASRYGHLEIVNKLLASDIRSTNAMNLAIAGGQDLVLKRILEANLPSGQTDERGYTPLHHSASRGYLESVNLLLDRDRSLLNTTTSDGSTALCLAVHVGSLAIVETLLRHGVNIAILDSQGYNALTIAARSGFSQIAQCLLDAGANPQISTRDGNTALHLAAQFGHLDTLDLLLRCYPDVHRLNLNKYSALHLAIREGFVQVSKKLLEYQPLPVPPETCSGRSIEDSSPLRPFELTTINPETPMQLAATEGHFEIVQILLDANTGHRIEDCSTALYLAASRSPTAILELFLRHGICLDVRDPAGNSILHQCIKGANASALSILLEWRLFDLNMPNKSGQTPLHKAAEIGSLEMVRKLLEYEINVSSMSSSHETPLHLAARRGHFSIVEELQSRMDDIEQENDEGETAFTLAVKHGHVAVVEYLATFQKGLQSPLHSLTVLKYPVVLSALLDSHRWDCNECSLDENKTPLHLAVDIGCLSAVKLLQEADADLDAKNGEGRTPLIVAVESRMPSIVEFLIDKGADMKICFLDGQTPLFIACWEGHRETVRVLLKNSTVEIVNCPNDRGWTPLHATYDESVVTRMLLENEANPRLETNNTRSTALAMASFNDEYIDVVRCHLEFDANPNQSDADGETAVHRSAAGNSINVMEVLIAHSAELDAPRNDGMTPLHIALENAEGEELAKLLVSKKVDIHKKDKKDRTALMAAAVGGHVSLADIFIQAGVDVNHVSQSDEAAQYTALQVAAYHGQLSMVQCLIRHKARINLPDRKYGSALFAAVQGTSSGVTPIMQELLKAGVDINYIDVNGYSILHTAVERELHEVVSLLLDNKAEVNSEASIGQAVVNGTVPMLEALLKVPGNALFRDKFGRSLLSIAIVENRKSIIEYLLTQSTTNINDKDHDGHTPLILSVLHKNTELTEILLPKNPNVDIRDHEGKTALIHACILDRGSSVDALLEKGASTLILDNRERGPLYWSCRHSSLEVLRSVLRAMSRDDSRESKKQIWGAFSAAIASNRASFVDTLLNITYETAMVVENDGWTPEYTAQQYGLDWIHKRIMPIEEDPIRASPKAPSAWSNEDKTPSLIVDFSGQFVTVADGPLTPGHDWTSESKASIRANYPMFPIGELGMYYFEVKIESTRDPGSWAVGFCEEQIPLNSMLGWSDKSWGYHGDDGLVFADGVYHDFGDTYTEGNVIGCGINFIDKSAFFTKDGEIIGKAFEGIYGKLYPAISVDQCMVGAKVSVKFWKGEDSGFQLDMEDLKTEKPLKRSGAWLNRELEINCYPESRNSQNSGSIILEEGSESEV